MTIHTGLIVLLCAAACVAAVARPEAYSESHPTSYVGRIILQANTTDPGNNGTGSGDNTTIPSPPPSPPPPPPSPFGKFDGTNWYNAKGDVIRGPVKGVNTTTPYLLQYGDWSAAGVEYARLKYHLIIAHPSSNISPAWVRQLQRGKDNVTGTEDDVIVLGYVSIGEDARKTAPVKGDGLGPRVDPRKSADVALSTIENNPLGNPSPGGTGYASYYMDSGNDGKPDRNSIFGGYYINCGAPTWFDVVKKMTKKVDGLAGMDEVMTNNTGLGYGFDGVFLDTLDTPAPNSYGSTKYEWTSPGYREFMRKLSNAYPDKLLLGNRGLFFYNPNLKNYAYTLRPYVNILLFESYYQDSDDSHYVSPYYQDNRLNVAPKLNAEMSRKDGYTMVALDYQHSPGVAQVPFDDIYNKSIKDVGWLMHIKRKPAALIPVTDVDVWMAKNPDRDAPRWDNTACLYLPCKGVEGTFVPRVGAQEAAPSDGCMTVRWDVALDQTPPVEFNIYYAQVNSSVAFDYNPMNGVTSLLTDVEASTPASYIQGSTSYTVKVNGKTVIMRRFPYEYTICGLRNNATYGFAVRAIDSAVPTRHEEKNTVVIYAAPNGTTPYVAPDPATINCPPLGPLLHGERLGGDWFNATSVATFVCDDGYYLVGDESMVCHLTGTWSALPPSCQPVDCGDPGQALNATRSLNDTTYPNTFTFNCTAGLEPMTNVTIQCMASGNWSAPPTVCGLPCLTPPLAPDNGFVNMTYRAAHFSCDLGYMVAGEHVLRCQANGTWDNESPACIPASCGMPAAPRHGATSMDGMVYLNHAWVTCDDGYTINGPSEGICDTDGNWQTANTTCDPVPCPAPAVDPNGDLYGAPYVYLSIVTLACHPGYHLEGVLSMNCLASGVWDEASLGTCIVDTVPAPPSTTSAAPPPDTSATSGDATSGGNNGDANNNNGVKEAVGVNTSGATMMTGLPPLWNMAMAGLLVLITAFFTMRR